MRCLAALVACCLAVLLSPWLAPPAAAEGSRVALVIGNSAYESVPQLANPSHDATAIAGMLKNANFGDVTLLTDVSTKAMRQALRDFSVKASGAEIAIVYYAGHGMEVNGINYLIPVDAKLERDFDVEDEAISLDRINQSLENVQRLRLIMLDACRDNPFVRSMKRSIASRSIGRGLAPIEVTGSDTLVAYATKAGNTASDGDGANSPFASALVRHLPTPGLDIRLALGLVRDDVRRSTQNQQDPFIYGSLGGAEIALIKPVPKPAQPASPAPPVLSEAAQAWQLVQDSDQPSVLEAFTHQFPGTVYAAMAQAKLQALQDKLAMKNAGERAPEPGTNPASAGEAPKPGAPIAATAWTATAKDVSAWKLKKTLRLGGALSSAHPSLDRTRVTIGAHRDGTIHVLDASLNPVGKIPLKPYKTYSLRDAALAPDNSHVLATVDGETRMYDLASGALTASVPAKTDYYIASLYLAADGLLFDNRASTAPQRSVIYFRSLIKHASFATTGELAFSNRVDTFDATADGKYYLASTYPGHQLELYDTAKKSVVWTMPCDCTARFAATGSLIVFAGRPGDDAGDFDKHTSIGVVSVEDPSKNAVIDTGTDETATLEDVSPDGGFAVIGFTNIGRVTIVPAALEGFRALVQLNDKSGQSISGAAFIGTDALITVSGDNNARLWSK